MEAQNNQNLLTLPYPTKNDKYLYMNFSVYRRFVGSCWNNDSYVGGHKTEKLIDVFKANAWCDWDWKEIQTSITVKLFLMRLHFSISIIQISVDQGVSYCFKQAINWPDDFIKLKFPVESRNVTVGCKTCNVTMWCKNWNDSSISMKVLNVCLFICLNVCLFMLWPQMPPCNGISFVATSGTIKNLI